MNLQIAFKFKDCKLQFYEKRRLFSYFSVNPRTPASRWRRLLKLKRKRITSFKIITGFFFTPPLFLATKVAISLKSKKRLEESTNRASERASECHSPHHIYNSLLYARNSRVKKELSSFSFLGTKWCTRKQKDREFILNTNGFWNLTCLLS